MYKKRMTSQGYWHRPVVSDILEAEVKGLQVQFYPGKLSGKISQNLK